MSSSDIYASIVACQIRIDDLDISIYRLQNKINEQEAVLSAFHSVKISCFNEFGDMKSHSDSIGNFNAHTVFAKRLQEKTSVELGQQKGAGYDDVFRAIQQKMLDEINTHCEAPGQQKIALSQEHDRLSQLHVEYNNALRAEEEQRRAAAEAATQNRW